ncbi:hypothetical protein HID58_061668 [Brassica napus]|uniref:Ribosomal protein L34Ae n=3 Tax=Brassica TaxID=3705 RepID=A0A3P6CBV5_BRAOL|nr:uncharacterized protein LOC106347822 isoform X1 [Brassica napus]KAH0885572.1 hypothetical protein HID58_061668 [Brassica napus]CAF1858809.1 unnamed protein product [Brassica napus]VDD11558.1 unnamed protein product [Brassica oleracea]
MTRKQKLPHYMSSLKKILISSLLFLQNLISPHHDCFTLIISLLKPIFILFSSASRDSTVGTDISKFRFLSELEGSDKAKMIEEEEGISELSKLVFKFEFQTETFERLSRGGYRSLSGSDESESSSLSCSPAIYTAEKKYESPSLAKNLTFVVENPKSATFRVEDCLKNREKTEDYGESESNFLSTPAVSTAAKKYESPSLVKNLSFVVENPKSATFRVEDCLKNGEKTEDYAGGSGESLSRVLGSSSTSPVIPTADSKYGSPSPAKNLTNVLENPKAATFTVEKTEDHSVSSTVGKKENSEKLRFLTEEDFMESDSDFVDSSQTFTSNEDGFLSDSDFGETSPPEEKGQNRKIANSSGSSSDSEEEEDEEGFESLWEHQNLIEQLKMEMKKVKAIGGLQTILEEEEEDDCPKIMEELKPWRIEEEKRSKHVDTIGEVHKFHRSYRERMRKLDILSFQKSFALGLLRSTNPSTVGSSPSQSSFSSVFNLRLWKLKKPETEPLVQFRKETHGELENVYVGHMCLSWEILHWQYEKAIKLLESDVYGSRRYNEVAGEFQQFQVLLQRFLENEPFEEPRVQHYIKKRRVLRNLLQVPVIREDGSKDKRKEKRRDYEENDDGAIKSEQLVEIMEETIRLFWRFVRFDKLTSSIHDHKSRTKSQIEPDHEENSEDLELFADVKAELQNKEKRLKDVLKSERCIIRRFKKHKEEDSTEEQVLHFFSQVDMKLVTRVLNMSKLTKDHLVWCHNKLTKISFVNRRLHLDPSFCLFPC